MPTLGKGGPMLQFGGPLHILRVVTAALSPSAGRMRLLPPTRSNTRAVCLIRETLARHSGLAISLLPCKD